MAKATFRFYEELNDFLPKHRRKRDFRTEFEGKRSIKDMVEALGVPPAKIDLILANGGPVGFDHILQDGDRFSVYPVFETLNIKNITRLRETPLRETRFMADKNLGAIASALQLLGLDVCFDPALSDREIVEISNREKRILLTKSRKLLQSSEVTHAVFVHPGTTSQQVQKIIEYLDLKDHAERAET